MIHENRTCKYCLEGINENSQDLIYPCNCSNGIHVECLAKWIEVRPHSNKYQCEICKADYAGIFFPVTSSSLQITLSNLEERELSIPNEFACCNCNLIEGILYFTSGVLFFGSVIMGGVTPEKNERNQYYFIMIMIMLTGSLILVLSLILTTKRYFSRFHQIRAINAIDE